MVYFMSTDPNTHNKGLKLFSSQRHIVLWDFCQQLFTVRIMIRTTDLNKLLFLLASSWVLKSFHCFLVCPLQKPQKG